MTKLTIFMLSCCILFSSCKKEPAKIISINPTEFTDQEQIKIGNAFKEAIEQSPSGFDILDKQSNKEAYNYLEKLFSTVLNTAQVERRLIYDWTIHVVHDDSIRTLFSLPGGHLYIYTGLLKFIDTESQLLEVIGHEIYYVDTDLLILKMKDEFQGKILGDILLDKQVQHISELAATMPSLHFEEEKVILADSFAVAIMCPFLYEPLGIMHVVDKAERESISLKWTETKAVPTEYRMINLQRLAIQCDLNGVTNEEAYKKFKDEYLP